MKIGNKVFDTEHETYVMGILNVTPDSFSDGGKWNSEDAALKHTEEMIQDGAAIIDIGGESTRPGHVRISDEEEIARVVPMIKTVKAHFDIPISVDTYKSAVAEAALDAKSTSSDSTDVASSECSEKETISSASSEVTVDWSKAPEDMSVEELQAGILAKMTKNGPVTDQMKKTVYDNIWHDSLVNWLKSFR